MKNFVFWYLILSVSSKFSFSNEIFKENREVLFEGEEKIKELQRLTLSPFGSCWTSVLAQLKTSCPRLDEESHSRLALGFSNCFMKQLGFKPIACDDDIAVCLEKVKSDTHWFTAYLQYHTHTHNMCYFLNHQLWLQKTELTIKKLTTSSNEIGKRLEETSNKQIELLRLQSDSVQTQENLLKQGQVLNSYLENSRSSMMQVFDEFKKSAEGQQTLVMDMLNKLSSWIQFLVDHVTSIYTVAFYFVISCILFIVTATPRTCKARAWLVFLWLTIFMSEFKFKVDYHMLWYMRYTGMSASFLVLLYFGMVYKDFETLNNKILNELYRLVQAQVQTVSLPQPQQALLPKQYNILPAPGFSWDHVRHSLNSSTIREIQDQTSDSDSSSDGTYVCDSDSDSVDSTTSFCSLSSSSSNLSSAPHLNSSNNLSISIREPDAETLSPSSLALVKNTYNLRPRQSLGFSTSNSSFVLKESPKSFGKLIKLQERNSKIQSILQCNMKSSIRNTGSESH